MPRYTRAGGGAREGENTAFLSACAGGAKSFGGAVIQFGVLGAARIVPNALLQPCTDDPRVRVRCVAARDRSRAEKFARQTKIPVVHNDYSGVLEDPEVDAVYNPLPASHHHEWSIKALRAGKHVLCEKPFASNAREAAEMAAVAKETGRVLMEAFHSCYHPVFVRALEIVRSGLLGPLRTMAGVFHAEISDPEDIRMNYVTGGGVTMDLGCYPISWVRHLAGEEPEEVSATAETGPPQVDVFLEANLRFPSGLQATISGDMRPDVGPRVELRVEGEKGEMRIHNPLAPQLGHRIDLDLEGRKTQETLDLRTTYSYQLDAFIDAIEDEKPLLTGAQDAVQQMRVIDQCYEAAGLPLRGLDLS